MCGRNHIDRVRVMIAALALGLTFMAGCQSEWHYWCWRDADVLLPMITDADRPLQRAGTPPELLAVGSGRGQVVLVASRIRDNPNRRDALRGVTYVAVLDGPLERGARYDITPANGRLILNASFLPARKPYEGIEGHVEILNVKGDRIDAECVFRNDVLEPIEKSYVLRGWYSFAPPTWNDLALLRKAGIEWIESPAPGGESP